MNALPRAARLVLPALLAGAAACAGSAPPLVPECRTASDCSGFAHCIDGACIADVPPTADFAYPATPGTNVPVRFVATASDPDDAVVSYAWTIAPGAGGCAPDPASGGASTLETIFFCAGAYEVALVAVDQAGAASAPRRVTIQVVQTPGAPSVTARPALDLAHRCAGAPTRCVATSGAADTFQLGATASDPDGDPIAYEWTAFPPALPAGAALPVATFVGGAASYAPTVRIESAGGPLAGTWRFRVRVTDGTGLVAQAVQEVRVANEPPVVVPGSAAVLPHRFEAGVYRAAGDVPFTIVDPDGDPAFASLSVLGAGASCTAAGSPAAGGAAVELACTAPADVIGPGRALRVAAVDVNGGEDVVDVPFDVGNRPPVVGVAGASSVPALLWFDHGVRGYEGGDRFFVSDVAPFVATDPDGDPVSRVVLVALVDGTRPYSTRRTWTDAGGETHFEFTTPVHSPGEFRSADGRSGFALAASASDPWTQSARLSVPVAIRNRPPGLEPLAAVLAVPHWYDRGAGAYRASATFGPFADPDGDPVTLGAGPAAAGPCAATGAPPSLKVECALAYLPASGPPTLAQLAGVRQAAATVADPWETLDASARVEIGNRGPSIWPQSVAWYDFECVDGEWLPSGGNLPVSFADPDGDPALVTPGAGRPPTTLLPPGGTILTVPDSILQTTLPVAVSDGVDSASTTFAVTYVVPAARCKWVLPPPDPVVP